MDQEQIAERQRKSLAYVQAREEKQKKLKKGRAHFQERKMEMFTFDVADVVVSAAALKVPDCEKLKVEIIVYSVCSPKDNFSKKIARGLLGYRALFLPEGFYYKSVVKSKGTKEAALKLLSYFITLTYEDSPTLSPRLKKAVIKHLRNMDKKGDYVEPAI